MTESRSLPELLAATSWPPTLRAAIQAVLDLHKPDEYGDCVECGVTVYEDPFTYPCPTVNAITEGLKS